MKSSNVRKINWISIRTVLLCALMLLFVCCTSAAVVGVATTQAEPSLREQTKTRLMYQARYEGWDPYSADMTLEEFYALMELFGEGKLPLESQAPSKAPSRAPAYANGAMDDPSAEDPSTGEPAQTKSIPREKFMISGIPDTYIGDNAPLEYDNELGGPEEFENYPAGLDEYSMNLKRPAYGWGGIELDSELKVTIVNEEENPDYWVGGNVEQSLFQTFDGYYVKQVTIDGAAAAVLGMVRMKGEAEEKYVYYYLSASDRENKVSTTMLPDGKKFIIQYTPYEHLIEYEVKMADGTEVPENITENSVFGKDHPKRTTDGTYAFDVVAPYDYQTVILLQYTMTVEGLSFNGTDYPSISFAVEEELTGTKDFGKTDAQRIKNSLLDAYDEYLTGKGITGFDRNAINTANEYTGGTDTESHQKVIDKIVERVQAFESSIVNEGYPLGTEPVYDTLADNKMVPNGDTPSLLTMNATYSNRAVTENRKIIALLKKNEVQPWFRAPMIWQGTDRTKGRGTSATADKIEVVDRETGETVKVPYDYEDEFIYLSTRGEGDSKYEWYHNGNNWNNGNAIGNIRPFKDNWQWNGTGFGDEIGPNNTPMTPNGDGTYSWQWTFQTNDAGQNYMMDVLQINGTSISLPFFPKYVASTHTGEEVPGEDGGGRNSWYTETTLPNGALITVEYLVAFGNTQRVYRVTVENAKSDISVTGMNLMQYTTGAAEFSVYNLTGVYLPQEGSNAQSDTAVEFYGKPDQDAPNERMGWYRTTVADIVVNSINYGDGSPDMYGANIRFKAVDGYGSPYYFFEKRLGGAIDGQTSVLEYEADGTTVKEQNEIINVSEFLEGGGSAFEKGFIYFDDRDGEGWYYIRLTGQKEGGKEYKMALLTIVARPAKYVVHYIPGMIDDEELGEQRKPANMPTFTHIENVCHPSFNEEYDDNNGFYYDLFNNGEAKLPTDESGVISPTDPRSRFRFKDWVAVDENGVPIEVDGAEFHFLTNSVFITDLYEYAVLNPDLGGGEVDIYVIRLKPTWEKIENPYHYTVVLRWVDAQGELFEEGFSDYWREVLTEKPEGGLLYVLLNTTAVPLMDWIADHPTYTFWDAVNNAVDDGAGTADSKIATALGEYLGALENLVTPYDTILAALKQLDYNNNGEMDFERLGMNQFLVHEDGGQICIWMYENKGGLVFHKEVGGDTFTHDEEFYFTVTHVTVGENQKDFLNGPYKAYPEFVYDENGNKSFNVKDKDAWVVTFTEGAITSIKRGGVEYGTHFALKAGEGIKLYVPAGGYTIAETGSKSGGSYKVEVVYSGNDGRDGGEGWDIPIGDDHWLKGSETEYHADNTDEKISQVAASVEFEVGEKYVVQTVTFTNKTMALSVEKQFGHDGTLDARQERNYLDREYQFKLTLTLPAGVLPPQKANGTHYFHAITHKLVNGTLVAGSAELTVTSEEGNVWVATFGLKPTESIVVVSEVIEGKIDYALEETTVIAQVTQNWTNQNGSFAVGVKVNASVTNFYGELKLGYLLITEKGGETNESFLYRIVGAGVDLIVSVKGNGQTCVCVPVGDYTVTEVSDWAWKYDPGLGTTASDPVEKLTVTVTVGASNLTPKTAVQADFKNTRNEKNWFGGENSESRTRGA